MYAQSKQTLYQKKWEIINTDSITKDKKLLYLDSYIEKARADRNSLEEYRALSKKASILPFDQAVMLLHKIIPLVQNLKNDSLTGDFLNSSTILYYKNRYFKEALDYAIQAEKFNEKINNQYNLNAARVDIGNIYYHTQRYQKAKEYFILAKNYYKNFNDYSHIQGYVSSLYSLSKCYWKLEELNALQNNIKENELIISKLNPQDQIIETAYLNYIKAGNAFLRKDYKTAQTLFENALTEIQKNEDITNEHVIYLYLGKIKWELNQKQQAIAYFSKIDSLFQENKFLNYELREAYNYLRTYYKETKQIELQLRTTESLIVLNEQFEKEQQHLTDALHYQLETKQLQAEKTVLQKQLNQNKQPYNIWLIVLIGTLVVVGAFVFWRKRSKIEAEVSLQNVEKNETNESIEEQQLVEEHLIDVRIETVYGGKSSQTEASQKEQRKKILSATEQRLLEQFDIFEAQKRFKTPITLEELALQLGTNRTTLSNFLNTHKGGYSNYFSKLRVSAVVNDLKSNKELRNKTLQELAFCYGFPNAKAFSSQFKTDVGVSPLDFIKQLDLQKIELEI